MVIFTDESENATSWEWDFGDNASPATASTQGPHMVAYAYPGTSTVSLTINGTVTETKENFIQVAAAPIAGFTFSGNGMNVSFSNLSQNALHYYWNFGDGNTSTDLNPEHTYAVAGTYQVSLVAVHTNMQCADTSGAEVMVPLVGINEIKRETSIRVYPNPSSGKFYVETTKLEKITKIELLDATGSVIEEMMPKYSGQSKINVDLSGTKRGIYFLKIISDTEVFVERILIQ